MPMRMLRAGARSEEQDPRAKRPRWTAVLVNNMPDGAFVATERQFRSLLEAAAGPDLLELHCYTMPGGCRGPLVAARIVEEYEEYEDIWADPPDILIVTGCEPVARAIEDEAYYSGLARLLSWASRRVPSMLLSCLAAHAALKVFDDIDRSLLATKCAGVFEQQITTSDPLAAGLVAPVVLPHSRLNAVPTSSVRAAGYDVAIESELTGWSVVTKRVAESNAVLVQGHPEYDPSSLLLEYQRDVNRYFRRERDSLPCLPVGCATGEDWHQLQGFQRRIVEGERDPGVVDAFPFEAVRTRATWPWRTAAITLYANWLAGVTQRSV